MDTLAAQLLSSLGLLGFAIGAHRVALRVPVSQRAFRYGWMFTAVVFGVHGLSSTLHDMFSIIAFNAGPRSGAWAAVLVWHPILNHSRTFLLTTYCVVFSVVLLRAPSNRLPPLPRLVAVSLAGMVAGAIVGANEHAFSGMTHYSAVAVWDMMELVSAMLVLLVGLSSGRMDRGLWASLGVYAFALALSVLWFAFLSRIDMGGQWAPQPFHIHLTKASLYGVMIVIAYQQVRRLRRGRPLRGFFDPPPPSVVPALHG